jgi:23S rRNA (uridine2552-2'-O)-methyltransferase
MARNKTSKAWMREHVTDQFVKRAARDGLRSRAAYKLQEINDRDNLVKRGMCVVDLGAAPGGWSQLVAPLVGEGGKVLALDILDMAPLANVEFIQGDFAEQAVLERLEEALQGRGVDLVLSDMAPNISGVRSTDQARWEPEASRDRSREFFLLARGRKTTAG